MGSFILNDFLPYQLAVLANRISEDFSNSYKHRFGITIAQWRVVAHLSQKENISIREIYKQVEMDKSKVSRAADRLVAMGYVKKRTSTADRRLIELSLTKSGRAMVAEIGTLAQAFDAQLLAGLGKGLDVKFQSALKHLLAART